MKENFLDIYASDVFSDAVMQQRLPKKVYQSLKATIQTGSDLDPQIADVVASAMKDWAVEKGATHFAHWFHPLTGATAEKHDSFLSPQSDRSAILEFSGKNLVVGEPDASSFPSGGLRDTFEARGYTTWDPTSPAFVRDGSLYIPTIFISYNGYVLDKKTPLLRSMALVDKEAQRILRLFGDTDTKRVIPSMGAEQEYFLVDADLFKKREDLVICGRTLFGAPAPKGQEFSDHYFGAINTRVAEFMKDADETLWRMGVPIKMKHSEVAPCQFEIVPNYDSCNVANDQNQLLMATLQEVARKHGLECLLHEKPFAGINGSGKHINWSLATDKNENLLSPGSSAMENARFLLFVCAMIHAVDEYPELLRLTIASAGNDHRLGGHEAPPAILSIFLGQELTDILENFEAGAKYNAVDKGYIELGVNTLPPLPQDISDRNRTSPFAFTGNKFEFRMPGSSLSTAGPNIAINTAIGDILRDYADRLEDAEDFWTELTHLLSDELAAHKRVIFNGNNYSEDWVEEAERRGLPNLANSIEAYPKYVEPKTMNLFVRNGIYSEEEVYSRMEIHMATYSRTINIEALTMIEMSKKDIIPCVLRYENMLAKLLANKKSIGLDIEKTVEFGIINDLSEALSHLNDALAVLEKELAEAQNDENLESQARLYQSKVLPAMNVLRAYSDAIEPMVDEWGIPDYTALLLGC
ncbi:MAG: glutamine synthetase III [Peptococcaceae bacterium]|jgi:glutamine synthetase|nr:glutamine synthetase III [Peptococcaceae bacterium]